MDIALETRECELYDGKSNKMLQLNFRDFTSVSRGSFGQVFSAFIVDKNEKVAIKKVVQNPDVMNRELDIMQKLKHPNIVVLLFYGRKNKKDGNQILYLMLEYMPSTVHTIIQQHREMKMQIPILYIQLIMYQLFRALAYIHSKSICHRDIKPNNILFNWKTGILKLCDFGSSKDLTESQSHISYVCSRAYRAPELLLGSCHYNEKIDIWSAGCVLCELYLLRPLFYADSTAQQIMEIIRVLGTPSQYDIKAMNNNYSLDVIFPQVPRMEWSYVLQGENDMILEDILQNIFQYRPVDRCSALEACAHDYFDYLRGTNVTLISGEPLPPLFDFLEEELHEISALASPWKEILLTSMG